MTTIQNYFQQVKQIKTSSLPSALKEGFEFAKEATENYSTWDYYHADKDIKKTIDEYLIQFSAFWEQQNKNISKPQKSKTQSPNVNTAQDEESKAREVAKSLIRAYVKRGDTVQSLKQSSMGSSNDKGMTSIKGGKIHVSRIAKKEVNYAFPLQSIFNEIVEKERITIDEVAKPRTQNAKPSNAVPNPSREIKATPVELMSDSVRLIKRFVAWHGKEKTAAQVLNYINALQKAILERKIRKTDTYAKEIGIIQKVVVEIYNKMKNSFVFELDEPTLVAYSKIAGSQKQRLSVAYMKRYIGLQGKQLTKDKAKKLFGLITGALSKQNIPKSDPYRVRIDTVLDSLKHFITKAKAKDTLEIHHAVLNGINEALNGCCAECDANRPCSGKNKKKVADSLNGLEDNSSVNVVPDEKTILNSMAFSELHFETLGFMGKWNDFIGDPTPGFTAMISGKPKMGKSYLCADFAGYLARNHGKTLFVAAEEKLSSTLQQKIDSVKHTNLDVTGALPDDLSPYEFIILDSVSRLKLLPEDLRRLKAMYPDKAFIYVYQVTKLGQFRGTNDAEHDVDIVIQVPEFGKAIQFGRFNQGGEMNIFDLPLEQ